LVYRSREIDASRVAVQWLNADGKMQPLLDKAGLFVNPRISPDSRRLAVANDDWRRGVWIYDIGRDTLSPLTNKDAGHPVWTPDGKYVVYQATGGIAWARADGASKAELLTQSKEFQYPAAFSPDGKWLAFHQMGQQGFDLLTLPVEHSGDGLKAGKPELFQRTFFGERGASFSSDGRWLAYSSNESGISQVYVRAFPDKGGRWQISSNGGSVPVFARNGRDLFFFDAPDDRIMVASYSARGDSFLPEKPRMWSAQSLALALSGAVGAQYDVSADGKRIAAATYAATSTQQDAGHVIFLENFVDKLQRKFPLRSN
jgi:Tol biopolymer transport system component